MSLDYAAWIQRAKNFLRQMHHLPGPIDINDGIQEPNDEGSRDGDFNKANLPAELAEFLRTASRRCIFFYHWKIPTPRISEFQEFLPNINELNGGCDFCEEAKYFLSANGDDWLKEMFQMMSLSAPASFLPQVRTEHGTILTELRDGTRLLLQDAIGQQSGPVLNSNKENPAAEVFLSNNFDEFLLSWEQIGYLSPTMENLRPWMANDRFAPDRAKAERFRELLVRQYDTSEVQP